MELTDENDPGRWAHSLGNALELVTGCLEAAEAKSVVEVGAYAGDLTDLLLDWADGRGATVTAVDPEPSPRLDALEKRRDDLTVIREPSLDALAHIEIPDAVIIDGDHNYYTVSGELKTIAEQVGDGPLPLLIFHDVGWPHARRDSFYVPERIPEEYREGMVEGAHVFPGESGLTPGGLPYKWASEEEGGPRNGVLTAIEDFVADREDLKLAIASVFFGVGVVWSDQAPYAARIEETIGFWDGNPIVERLEKNRILHLATSHQRAHQAWYLEKRIAWQERILRELIESSAFAAADRLSHLKARGKGETWREQIEEALDDPPIIT